MHILFYSLSLLIWAFIQLSKLNELQEFQYTWLGTQPLSDVATQNLFTQAIYWLLIGIAVKLSK